MKTIESQNSTLNDEKKVILDRCPVCLSQSLQEYDRVAELQKCNQCTFVFANPRPTLKELANYYSKPTKYDEWISSESERTGPWKRRWKKLQKTKRRGSLLDVGAGIGEFLDLARPYYEKVLGTELSTRGVEIAKEKYQLDILQGDLMSLDVNTTFDDISLFHVLEHVPDPRALLERCYNLLNPGGRLIIAVPNDLNSWELKVRTRLRRLKGTLPSTVGKSGLSKIVLDGSVDEIHLSQFTQKSLIHVLKDCGFSIHAESLDPYFAKKGLKLVAFFLYYQFHCILHFLFKINRYNTIWVVAKKDEKVVI